MSELNELAKALCLAQSKLKPAAKDTENPFFKSRYADLASVWDACREALTSSGLAVIQTTEIIGDKLYLKTTLMHTSGQYVHGVYPINPIKNDPQSIGSAITYARRYALAAIVGVVQSDDDAHAATHHEAPKPMAQMNLPNMAKKPSGKVCQIPECGAELVKNKKGDFSCPNWKDQSKGKHTYIESSPEGAPVFDENQPLPFQS